MPGLLSDVLPAVYGAGDWAKKRVNSLLDDPIGDIKQTLGKAGDDLRQLGLLSQQAYGDKADPMRVTDQKAADQLAATYLGSVLNFAPIGMAIDPKAQKKLVDGLLGNGNTERYRLGDITRNQANEAYVFGGKPIGESVDVYVTPNIGQEHARVSRILDEGFLSSELGLYSKQAMRPDSKIIPPATANDYPVLRSESMLDPVTRKRYNAEMPLRPVDDGFEMISIIPRGLPARKKPR